MIHILVYFDYQSKLLFKTMFHFTMFTFKEVTINSDCRKKQKSSKQQFICRLHISKQQKWNYSAATIIIYLEKNILFISLAVNCEIATILSAHHIEKGR